MGKGKDKNYVPVWFWMLAMLVTAIPCVGVIMIIVWAIIGENESRKNYFRALIAWFLIFVAVWTVLMLLGFWPQIQERVADLIRPVTEQGGFRKR